MDFDFSEVLRRMVEAKASDVHLTAGAPPSMRDKGKIVPMEGFAELTTQDTREVVFSILNDDQRKRFENNKQLDFAYAIPGVARFRVNCFFQRGSVSAAFRLVPQEIPALDSLKVPQVLRELAAKPRGFVLITGPTGSGKSTTLAAMIDVINSERQDHILTIEDPIEFLHSHKRSIVNQREIGSDAADFALGLRAALREDPDVILVGEMRDLETISTALTAAETGHLVFATLHTQSTAQTVDRIIDVFPPQQQGQVRTQLSIALQGIVTQQLLPTADGTGRVVACEVLVPTPAIRNLIREGKTHQIYAAVQTSGAVGMQTMDADLARLVRAGAITRKLAEQRASVPEELKRLLGGAALNETLLEMPKPAGMAGNGAAQQGAPPVPTAAMRTPAPPPPPSGAKAPDKPASPSVAKAPPPAPVKAPAEPAPAAPSPAAAQTAPPASTPEPAKPPPPAAAPPPAEPAPPAAAPASPQTAPPASTPAPTQPAQPAAEATPTEPAPPASPASPASAPTPDQPATPADAEAPPQPSPPFPLQGG